MIEIDLWWYVDSDIPATSPESLVQLMSWICNYHWTLYCQV